MQHPDLLKLLPKLEHMKGNLVKEKCFLGIPEPRQNKVPCGFWDWQDSPLHFTFLNHNIPLLWYVSAFPVSARATSTHEKAQFLLWFCRSCCLPKASSVSPHHRAPALHPPLSLQGGPCTQSWRPLSPGRHAGLPQTRFLTLRCAGDHPGAAAGTGPGSLADTALKKRRGEKLVEKCPLQPSC